MMEAIYHYKINEILFYLFITLTIGCVSTGSKEPNPIIRQYPGYAILSSKDKLLADELGRLPEIQDGISASDKKALDRLSQCYQKKRFQFLAVFEEMLKVGLAEHRKYCSPLQALYWLFEDDKLQDVERIFRQYYLKELLDRSWKPVTSLSDRQLLALIGLIKDNKLKEQCLKYVENGVDNATRKTVHLLYKNEPHKFLNGAAQIVKSERWNRFEPVADRLSSPDLLHYYINNMNFQYREKVGPVRSPKEVFLLKRADAADMANFGHYVLSRAGYKTFGRRVYHPFSDGHVGLAMKTPEGLYSLVVDFRRNSKNMKWGVFESILKLDQILGYGRKYPLREKYRFKDE